MPLHKALTRSQQEAFSRDSQLVHNVLLRKLPALHQQEFLQSDRHFPEHGWICQAIRLWDIWDPGYLDWEAWIGICQLCPKNPAKGAEFLLLHVPLRVPKGHELDQYPPSGCTLSFQWSNPLSMVWEGRAEWGNGHQPFADGAPQAMPGVQEVFLLSLYYLQSHLVPQPEELPALHRRRPWQVIFISLTTSIRLTGSRFQRRDLDRESEGGSNTHQTTTLGIPHPIKVEWNGD